MGEIVDCLVDFRGVVCTIVQSAMKMGKSEWKIHKNKNYCVIFLFQWRVCIFGYYKPTPIDVPKNKPMDVSRGRSMGVVRVTPKHTDVATRASL